jgi:hypothetical protein
MQQQSEAQELWAYELMIASAACLDPLAVSRSGMLDC